ncbi:MAG: hypothetical protein JST08_17995 [Actinobacteria bacterium]|nr:hypothetical protein [Actinomycetota bacterium]
MRRLAPLLVLIGLAAVAAVAFARVGGAPAARATVTAATGAFEISNSRAGQPVFAAAGIAPGGSAVGTVTIEDTGSAAAALVLRRGELIDTEGVDGGVLSAQLWLSVADVTAPGAPRSIYAGRLATMPDQAVGEVQPGEARTFEFTATLPAAGEPGLQNAVQGASTTVAYMWVAEEPGEKGGGPVPPGEGPGTGEAGPGGSPPGEPGASPAPAGTDSGPAGESAVLTLTVPKIIRTPRGGRLVVWTHCDARCRVTVRGRLRATAAGRHRGAPVHFTQKRLATAGPQRLRIPIPRKLGRWLRHAPPPKRLRAKLRFVAVGADGQRDVVQKRVRIRTGGGRDAGRRHTEASPSSASGAGLPSHRSSTRPRPR